MVHRLTDLAHLPQRASQGQPCCVVRSLLFEIGTHLIEVSSRNSRGLGLCPWGRCLGHSSNRGLLDDAGTFGNHRLLPGSHRSHGLPHTGQLASGRFLDFGRNSLDRLLRSRGLLQDLRSRRHFGGGSCFLDLEHRRLRYCDLQRRSLDTLFRRRKLRHRGLNTLFGCREFFQDLRSRGLSNGSGHFLELKRRRLRRRSLYTLFGYREFFKDLVRGDLLRCSCLHFWNSLRLELKAHNPLFKHNSFSRRRCLLWRGDLLRLLAKGRPSKNCLCGWLLSGAHLGALFSDLRAQLGRFLGRKTFEPRQSVLPGERSYLREQVLGPDNFLPLQRLVSPGQA